MSNWEKIRLTNEARKTFAMLPLYAQRVGRAFESGAEVNLATRPREALSAHADVTFHLSGEVACSIVEAGRIQARIRVELKFKLIIMKP